MIGIVVSRADEVSTAIGEQLLDLGDWTARKDTDRPEADGGGTYHVADGFELRTFDDLHLELEGVAEAFADPDLVIFVSRHSGETGPLLTAHVTGNFGAAEFGGEDGRLAEDAPNAKARVLAALDSHAPDGYDVCIECTHHGPSEVGAPALFVEHGSGPEQWADEDASRAVARAVLDLRGVSPHRERQVVGIGGSHYAPRFTRITRETDWAVGHIAADWCLDALRERFDDPRRETVLSQAFEQSRTAYAVLDGDDPHIAATIEDLGYRVVSETWLRETAGVPLELVERIEDAIGSIDDGLRFGSAVGEDGVDFETAELPADLLAETTGIDRERTMDAVDAHALAYDTEEGGTIVSGPVAVAEEDALDAVVGALIEIVETAYDSVERDGDVVCATERAFDPDRARDFGVPEGPAFGRLASGNPVTVDGETVTPADVTVERVRRFRVR